MSTPQTRNQNRSNALEPHMLTTFPNDHSAAMTSSFHSSSNIHDVPQKVLNDLVSMILFSLDHLGCDAESISHVLVAYELDHVMDSYIEFPKDDESMMALMELYISNKRSAVQPLELQKVSHATVLVYEVNKRPVKTELISPWLPGLISDKNVLIQTVDGRRISTSVTNGRLVYSIDQPPVIHSIFPANPFEGSRLDGLCIPWFRHR